MSDAESPPITLLVAGSRETNGFLQAQLNEALNAWVGARSRPVLVIHGGAAGIDKMAGVWAESAGLDVKVYVPDWKGGSSKGKYNPGAGLARNTEMVDAATHVVVFWNGHSKGTADTIAKAKAKGRALDVIRI